MIVVRPADLASIERLVEDMRSAEPTYAETGATLTGERPSRFHYDHYEKVLGRGTGTFQRAIQGLQSWQAHRLPGIRIVPEETEIRPGATVIVTLGTPLVALAAPCRIVEMVDEPGRWGFAYGTLPGHLEQGEEAFVATIAEDESVHFEITAFFRPTNPIVRLTGPLGRGLQRSGTNGYLRALRRFVDREA